MVNISVSVTTYISRAQEPCYTVNYTNTVHMDFTALNRWALSEFRHSIKFTNPKL